MLSLFPARPSLTAPPRTTARAAADGPPSIAEWGVNPPPLPVFSLPVPHTPCVAGRGGGGRVDRVSARSLFASDRDSPLDLPPARLPAPRLPPAPFPLRRPSFVALRPFRLRAVPGLLRVGVSRVGAGSFVPFQTRVLAPSPKVSAPAAAAAAVAEAATALRFDMLYNATWKFMLIHMTMLSLKGQPFFPTHVLAQARRRIRRKLEGAKEGIRICVIRADAKEQEPKLHQYRKWLRGIRYIRDTVIGT